MPTTKTLPAPTAPIVAALATLLYATVLFYAYRDFVSPTYAYQGLTFRNPEPFPYLSMVALTAFVAALLPTRIRHPSDLIIWLLFVMAAAPSMLLAQYMTMVPVGQATQIGVAVAATTVFIRVLATARPRIGGLPAFEPSTVWLSLAIVAALVYIALVVTAGFTGRWVSFAAVYDVRAAYAIAESSVPFLGYLVPVVYNVINPAFMARGMYARGKRKWLAAGVGGQLLIYVSTGQKAVLFSLLAVAAIMFLYRRGRQMSGVQLLVSLVGVAVTSIALDKLLNTVAFNDLLVRRFMVFPGAITVAWVAVFDGLPKGNFAGTAFFWLEDPYGRGPSFMVGRYLTENQFANAGVNPFGHGFYEYGYIGMFIEAFILVLVLWALDAACQGLPMKVIGVVLVMSAFTLSGANILTALTSHGLAAAVIICAVLPRTGWERQRSREVSSVPAIQSRKAVLKNRM